MATELHPVRPAPAVKAPSAKKHEAFVEAQLARARARIRSLDVAAAGLGLMILTLAYGLVMVLCDRWLELPALARQSAFAVYAAGGLVYLALVGLRPLCRQINPYYAARRLEQTIPEAKNSVVNWLDLHEQTIAPAFRSAIGQQAAKDLADADLEQAISAHRTSWLGAGAAALFVSLLVLFVLGPRQFLSLMNRAFAPFVEAPIATRTRLLLVRPEGGDVTVPVGRAVAFSVWVEGRVPEASSPEALKLLYRHNPNDPYQTRLLERGDSSREWFTAVLASEVHNGFWYRLAGGDAETPEYRVRVRSTPLLTGFDVTYHYRPYLGWPDRTTHDQNLQDLRGTEVTLLARTNRTLREGQLVIDRQQPIRAEPVPEDRQAMRFRFRLEKDGTYRIWFTSAEGERNTDPMPYTIRVLQDHPPQVELTQPGQDSRLPANGLLRLEGSASDDFGIASLNLRLKVENGATLRPKPYRNGQALRRGDGSYPQMLGYRDSVELDKLQREDGQPLEPLAAGATIEYWLEATDNCDYPGPNVGESKHFKVTIAAADPDKNQQEQQRQEARQEQENHEKKQDQDLRNQKKEPRDTSPQQSAPPNAENPQPNDGDKQNEENLQKQKERIEDAIKQREQQQKAGDNPQESKGEGKGEGQSERQVDKAQSKAKEGEGKAQPGQEKGEGKTEARREKGEQKGEGQAAPKPDGAQEKNRGQGGAERRTDPAGTEGNKAGNEPAPDQKDGPNQANKSNEPRPGPNGGGQAQDRANPKSANGEKNPKPKGGEGTAGANANTGSDQDPGKGRQKDSGRGEEKNGPEDQHAKPNPGQGAAGEKPEGRKEQSPGERQRSGSAAGDKKPQPDQANGDKAGANNRPEAGAEKGQKKGPGQEGAERKAGQPDGDGKPGANAEKAQEKNQNQQAGNPQGGPKKDEGKPGPRPEKGQEKGPGEPQANKAGESQSEPQPGNQAAPKGDGKGGDGQGGSGEPKGTAKESSNGAARANASKLQEKPAGADKDDAGNRATANAENKGSSGSPGTRAAEGPDKADDKGNAGSRSRQDANAQARQPKPEGQSGTEVGEKLEDVSALSEALKGGEEKARQDARKKLAQLRDRAKDPGVRQAAADALKQAGEDTDRGPGQQPHGAKPGTGKGRAEDQAPSKAGENAADRERGKGGDQNTAAQKANERGTGRSDTAKGEPKDGNPGTAKDNSGSEIGERGNPAGSSQKPGGSGASGNRGGSEPTGRAPKPTGSPDSAQDPAQDPIDPGTAPNAAYKKQAGELQLEEIKKKVNKDVLEQLKMTEEDFRKFVKAYEEMLKRKQATPAEKENLAGPHSGNRSPRNQDVRLVEPREQGKAGNLQRTGPALAPPEFREAYKEFSRRISELEQAKGKK